MRLCMRMRIHHHHHPIPRYDTIDRLVAGPNSISINLCSTWRAQAQLTHVRDSSEEHMRIMVRPAA